jgi:predicted membrane protein
MHLAIFGSTDAAGFAPRWTSETVVVIFGSALLDLTERLPADDATLNVRAVFGSVKVIVPSGTRLSVQGLSLFGERRVKVQAGEGPTLRLRAGAVFGTIEVIESPRDAIPPQVAKSDERIFLPETGITSVEVGVQPG